VYGRIPEEAGRLSSSARTIRAIGGIQESNGWIRGSQPHDGFDTLLSHSGTPRKSVAPCPMIGLEPRYPE
jgi:hypothetical protein